MSSYGAQAFDTTEVVDRQQFDLWRQMPDWRKLQLFGELCDTAKAMAEAGREFLSTSGSPSQPRQVPAASSTD